jgi:uncharacterized protein (DUF1697 family)
MTVWVALLRGVNVGGKAKVAMPALRSAIESAGATEVRTYIQSGNVVFTHAARSAATLEGELEQRIHAAFGFDVPVLLRNAPQMRAVVDANPYPGTEGTKLHVVFLRDPPDAAALAKVHVARFAPEELTVVGRELYLHLPHGIGRAKLPPALGKVPGVATARNWNTVTKLLAMTET